MKRLLLLAPALMAFMTPSAHAAPPLICNSTLCSRNFYAAGDCNGQDNLAMLTDPDKHKTQMVEPWEPVPITIVGVHLKLISGEVTYAFAGNSYTPDIMRWLDERDTFYPSGTGFAFPASGSEAHIDFHYSCLKGSFQAFYTVYYTVGHSNAVAEAR